MCCKSIGMSLTETNAFILRMFTITGAKALGREVEIGLIREGYRADLAVLDQNHLEYLDVIKGKTELPITRGRVHIN